MTGGFPSAETIHLNRSRPPRSGRITAVGVTSVAVSTGASRPPGRPATSPPVGKASPPPIPGLRSVVRLETQPEPPRITKSPLVGRNDQLETLSDVVARAIDFQAPQLVTVVGNQGTGKTRLIQELEPLLAQRHDGACRVYHGHAERDAEGKPVRHAALASLLRNRFELLPVPDETSRLRFAHEVRAVMGSDHVAEMLYFVGGFIGIDYPPTPFLKAVAESPKQHAEIARIALRRFVELEEPAQRNRRWCSCSTTCSGPTATRSAWSARSSRGSAARRWSC